MLKYQINRRQVQSQRQLLDIDRVEMVDFPSETGDKSLMIFYYPTDKDYKFEEGQELEIQVNCETNNNNDLNSTTYTYKDTYTLLKVNQEKGLFTCQVDKYYDLQLHSFNRQSVVLTVIEYVQNSTYPIKGNYYSFNGRYYKCIKTSDTPIDKSIEELKDEGYFEDYNVDEERWYLYFDQPHLFNPPIEEREYTEGSKELNYKITIFIDFSYIGDKGISVNGLAELKCQYENPYELSYVFDGSDETINKLRSVVFTNEKQTEDNDLIFGDVNGLKVYRETPYFQKSVNSNFLTNTNNIFIYIEKPLYRISIPLSVNFETNAYQSYILNEQYVEDERNKSINKITDMEKDVYHPVIWDSSKLDKNEDIVGDYVDGINKEVDKIVFNLHFRQHRGDDWLVEPDTYWNGCYVDTNDNKVKFIDEIEDYKKVNYFSYNQIANQIAIDETEKDIYKDIYRSKQPDLLTYLGFENSDVRYQKNKLSRSFIRIMFYDSMNPGNQNLLYYSTIFVDSGKLFGKYINHIEDTPYNSVVYETNEETEIETINAEKSQTGLVGIRVDREPTGDLLKDEDDVAFDNIDQVEELRLSCQFTVQDKFQSKASSDGFYLYLWKDNESGVIPSDIYMKVEFNHAGFGRTIPFMMPFWDKNKYEKMDDNAKPNKKKGIKTFNEILNDWNSIKNDNGVWQCEIKEEETIKTINTDGQYGARQYLKYSYIHFKYKYDKIHKQHIYYLDDDFYGTDPKKGGVHYKDNVMTINLYEAKMI